MSSQSRPSGEPVTLLPERANLDHLKNEAKSLLKDLRKADPSAQLASAQLIVARKYGFSSWRTLRSYFSERTSTLDIDQSEGAITQRRYEQFRPRKAVPIDPKRLDFYVGYYQLAPYLILSIKRIEDHLEAQLTGQPSVPLFAENEVKFFFNNIPGAIVPGQISFVTDGNNRAEKLILHQSGHNQPAKRIEEAEEKAAAEHLARRLKENTPLPGSEDALRRIIEGELRGKPDYRQMTKAMALITSRHSPTLQKELVLLGEFRHFTFKGVARGGADVFEAVFAGGSTEWRIRLGEDEKVIGLIYRVLP
jgi:hypothetical protein